MPEVTTQEVGHVSEAVMSYTSCKSGKKNGVKSSGADQPGASCPKLKEDLRHATESTTE